MENSFIYIFRKNKWTMKYTFIIIMIMISGSVRPAETAHHCNIYIIIIYN